MHPPVAPQPRYRAAVTPHQQQRNGGQLAARIISMASSSCDSAEPCVTQRPPVAALQPSAEETSSESAHQAAEARPEEPAAVEAAERKKKKDTRAAAEDAPGTGSCLFGAVEPARRPTGEESARERLKRHRTEMAGRVRIPDMWGQERLLKDWVDCAVFDRPLAATAGLLNARDALVAECAAARRSTGRPLRVQNGCS
ncbi:hypothetical protein PR202_gb08672 [Eleusine coracana subsp. coracana]|uniref:Uncharacterized protein n=1 Tax=Eleusine coracana subsp. coracana TaxID=191504 RepID=A0AAV5EGC0_ELECO|nr:hypothetical protein QOZ80_2BG0188220 [Eleusine coracana subsp. coracana]GJN21211.1 hypothetical protein PR202_gb08672 [Eleusine coracana subsp. coracana]